ncbi:beta-ketoacyl synthase chain length factor [Neisseria leonii]|uniref:Beta-ketoacyl synthase chain length factor n=1 Tax=Neisseria leonii TaxID=2995413 RepID=A0A9X4E1N9_9NEIS|nr:beta-ketoacyl synthase chain length factor [Neisseria sp. 51.81]MDD9327843.1 beta-ketoacyl synthase chain length factor [Neisseria sp. 51.81]
MMADVFRFSFNIAAWRAVSGRMAGEDQWARWAAGVLAASDVPPYRPAAEFLPPLKRRRLNFLAKLMGEAVWPLHGQFGGLPMVYASHDGEINRSFELWLSLWREQAVSPTSFGLSVHNALPGQWSMLVGDKGEHTALAVGSDGLETALAECCALLNEGKSRVLLVLADEPLDGAYAVAAERAPFPYVLAMVLERGCAYELACLPDSDGIDAPYWGALDWIRFMLTDEPQYERRYRGRVWRWCKGSEHHG